MERLSVGPLRMLTRTHRFALPLLSAVLLLAGLGLPPAVGLPFLAALALLVGWLSYLSWPVVEGGARVVRLVTLLLIVVGAVNRLR